MMNQNQVNQLCEDNELAFFRADACLGSPQSFALEEKAAICDEMEAARHLAAALPAASFNFNRKPNTARLDDTGSLT